MADEIKVPVEMLEKAMKATMNLTRAFQDMANVGSTSLKGVGTAVSSLDGSLSGMSTSIDSSIKAFETLGSAVGKIVPGVGALTASLAEAATTAKSTLENIGGAVSGLQESALQFDRVSIGIRQSFGKAFAESADETRESLRGFRDSVIEARRTTYQPFGDIIRGAEQLGKVFTEDQLVDVSQFQELGNFS